METLREEQRAIRRLRFISDVTCRLLGDPEISLSEALNLIYEARTQAVTMFPGKADTFDMIYGRRFHKILECKGRFFSASYPFWN